MKKSAYIVTAIVLLVVVVVFYKVFTNHAPAPIVPVPTPSVAPIKDNSPWKE